MRLAGKTIILYLALIGFSIGTEWGEDEEGRKKRKDKRKVWWFGREWTHKLECLVTREGQNLKGLGDVSWGGL